jgi:hypothetical protein
MCTGTACFNSFQYCFANDTCRRHKYKITFNRVEKSIQFKLCTQLIISVWKSDVGSQLFVIRSPFVWHIFSAYFSVPPVTLLCIHFSSHSPFYFDSATRSSWPLILPVISFLFLLYTLTPILLFISSSPPVLSTSIFHTRFILSVQDRYCSLFQCCLFSNSTWLYII